MRWTTLIRFAIQTTVCLAEVPLKTEHDSIFTQSLIHFYCSHYCMAYGWIFMGFFFTLTCMEWIFFLGFQHIWNITSGIYRWSHCIWWIFFRCLGFTITCFFLYIYTWATFNKLFICALPTKTVETLVYYIRIFKFVQSCFILNKYWKLTAF